MHRSVGKEILHGNGKTRQAAKDALLKKLDAEEKKNLTSVPVKSETLSDAIDHFLKYKLSEGVINCKRLFNQNKYKRATA